MIDLTNASYHEVNNAANQTVVAAGANINGVIIKRAYCSHYSGAGADTNIKVNGNAILRGSYTTGGSAGPAILEQEYFVPAGQAITIGADGSASYANIHYEVL